MTNYVSCAPVEMTSSRSSRWLCASICRMDGEWVVNVLPGLYEYREEAWAVAIAHDCHLIGVHINKSGQVAYFFETGLNNPAAKYSPDLIIHYGLGSLSYEANCSLKPQRQGA